MHMSAERIAGLNPKDRANFATTARLLSCLVTESLLRALYFPLHGFQATGFSVVLGHRASSKPPSGLETPDEPTDILAIVLLRDVPVFRHDGTDPRGKEIALLDPFDMMPLVFEIEQDGARVEEGDHCGVKDAIINTLLSRPGWAISQTIRLFTSPGPLSIWDKFATGIGLEPAVLKEISNEFSSSLKWQQYSYENPPHAPLFSSPSIEWEQSIVEGHPTHPMHKTRFFLPPLPDFAPGTYDLYHPTLRLIAIPRKNLHITYDFEYYTQPILDAMSTKAGRPVLIGDGHVAVPVHELQLVHIEDKFKEAVIYPEEFSLPLLAQQSIRSLVVPDVYRDLSLKLGVGIKLTSAVRTISPASAYLGPRFSKHVVPVLSMDPKIATVAKELATVVHVNPDGEVAKHCSAIIRESYEIASEERGERLIVCTALTECGHRGDGGDLPAVIRVFELYTEEKRLQWFSKFARMLFDAFLPSMLHNGVAFECHPQNTVARFDLATKVLLGFIVRDFGGMRIHPPTLKSSTGVDVDVHPGHSTIADDLDDVYTLMYHSMIQNHLQQLIRVLGLHYNGLGWKVAREHLEEVVPREHALYAAWLSPERKTLPSKCFMRMRVSGMYRFDLHNPFPNLLLYRGVSAGDI